VARGTACLVRGGIELVRGVLFRGLVCWGGHAQVGISVPMVTMAGMGIAVRGWGAGARWTAGGSGARAGRRHSTWEVVGSALCVRSRDSALAPRRGRAACLLRCGITRSSAVFCSWAGAFAFIFLTSRIRGAAARRSVRENIERGGARFSIAGVIAFGFS